jgi:hypothetical protein
MGDFLMGGQGQIGSVDDVKLANKGVYGDFMKGLGSLDTFGKINDTYTNYDNFLKQMLGGGGAFETMMNATQGGNPNAAVNSWLSYQPQLAGLADQSLSGLYDSGRSQAQAAGADARRAAAGDLAAAGLLNSGGAVGAMTEATAAPILNMETQLANTRAGYLGNLQSGVLGSLQSGYNMGNQMLQNFAGMGLQALGGQSQLGLAALNTGAQMAAPEYWQPQYQQKSGLFDYLNAFDSGTDSLGSMYDKISSLFG